MNAEISATSGIAFSAEILSSSDNAALGFVPTTATELEDFSAATFNFYKVGLASTDLIKIWKF